MAATLAVIWWRDIPAQVVARDGGRSHKIALDGRFQAAIDRAAMRAGLSDADAYTEAWRRESEPCGDDLESAAAERATALESRYTPDLLEALVAAGGDGTGIAETDRGGGDPG